MGRRPRGDGSVFYDASRGCWTGLVNAGRDPDTGKRRRRKVTAATKTACRDKLAELRDELRKTGSVAPRNVTVAQVLAAWIERPPSSVQSPISVRVLRRHAERLTAAIGSVPVVKLTPPRVESALAAMAADGLATSTIQQCNGVLARALRRAQRDGLVARNVAELADMPRGTVRKSRSMSLEQAGLPARPGDDAVVAGLPAGRRSCCGLRPGELLGLSWEDVDLAAGTIRVRRALHEEPGPDGRLALILADLKTSQQQAGAADASPDRRGPAARCGPDQAADRLRPAAAARDHGLVFCAADRQADAGRAAVAGPDSRRLCERAGLGSDWHPHEQRHTFVSVLSDAGERIEAIAAAAGHQSPATTRRVYWHAIASEITTAAEAMDGIFGTSPEEPS